MLDTFQLLSLHLSAEAVVSLPAGYAPAAQDANSRTVILDALQKFVQLDATSTPAPAQVLSKDITFDGTGTLEIDLTDAPIVGAVDGDGEPADGESLAGLRLMCAYFTTCRADGLTNAGNVTVRPGATDGYNLWGAANEVDLPPNSRLPFYVESASLPAVAAGAKQLAFDGATGDKLRVLLVFR